MTNATVGAGLLHFSLRRSQNVHWQAFEVDTERPKCHEGSPVGRCLVHRHLWGGKIHDRQPY